MKFQLSQEFEDKLNNQIKKRAHEFARQIFEILREEKTEQNGNKISQAV